MLDYIKDLGMKKCSGRSRHFLLVKCSYCGKVFEIRKDTFKKAYSCGCIKKEIAAKNVIKNHTHKMSRTRLYCIWQNLKNRCNNPNDKSYKNYGGRGITVCDEWINCFENFKDWALRSGYSEELTIDRINNNGNYKPSNCRWATNKTQCRNRRSNIVVNYQEKNITLIELSELTNIPYATLNRRYKEGDRNERLIRKVGEERLTNKGSKNRNSKLKENDVIEIKKMLLNGVTQIEIAKKFNVSKYAISDIKRKRSWKHIEV